jgi:hypothetical protein
LTAARTFRNVLHGSDFVLRGADSVLPKSGVTGGRHRSAVNIDRDCPPTQEPVARHHQRAHARPMFAVDDAAAEAIRRLLDESGELAAAVEVRRLFPGIPDLAKARDCARIIASWGPLPPPTATRETRPRR